MRNDSAVLAKLEGCRTRLSESTVKNDRRVTCKENVQAQTFV